MPRNTKKHAERASGFGYFCWRNLGKVAASLAAAVAAVVAACPAGPEAASAVAVKRG